MELFDLVWVWDTPYNKNSKSFYEAREGMIVGIFQEDKKVKVHVGTGQVIFANFDQLQFTKTAKS